MDRGLGRASIKREGQAMLDMCSTQCEGVHLMKEIEQLRETVSMLAGDRDLYMEEIKQKNAEIERLRKFIKEHDMAEVLEDWENA